MTFTDQNINYKVLSLDKFGIALEVSEGESEKMSHDKNIYIPDESSNLS